MHSILPRSLFAVSLSLALITVNGQKALPPDLEKTGEQAYLFAYPLVLRDAIRRQVYAAVGSNRFTHQTEFPTDRYRTIARPNADTLYSVAGLDLSTEPVLLRVADTRDRYYVVQLMDAWTETVASFGKRTTGTAEGWFAMVGPAWSGKLPKAVTRIDVPTKTAALMLRIQTNTAADYEKVRLLQRQFWLIPLSRYPNEPEAPPHMDRPSQDTVPPPQAVAGMSTVQFFELFASLLANNPPHAVDGLIVEQLAALGIEAGKPLSAAKLHASFEEGVARARQTLATSVKIAAGAVVDEGRQRGRLAAVGKTGWSALSGLGRYGVDYLKRAVVALVAYAPNLPEDAVYFSCGQDGAGAPLNGTRRYVMHFDRAQLPPVQAFWSVTLYDRSGYFAANPLNRYAIGDRDALKYNSDGSLDLYVQHESPGPERQSNWLPAPAEPFTLTFRLYWPKEPVLKGEWIPPLVTVR